MAEIMTVLGPIAPGALGFTSMHEHILLDARAIRRSYLSMVGEDARAPIGENTPVAMDNLCYHHHCLALTWDNLLIDDESLMASEIADYKTSGGSALLDMSAVGLRSNVSGIQRISKETGVHIITPTGLYGEYTWPERFRSMATEEYVAYMFKEIAEGIDDTGIKPGHIKIAIENDEITPQEEKVLRAAARVSKETNLSATFHNGVRMSEDGGRRMITILLDEGISPDRALICHVQQFIVPKDLKTLVLTPDSWRLNLGYIKEVLDQGMNICIDCFGYSWDMEEVGLIPCNDYHRLAAIIALVNAGYAQQIVIGTDLFTKMQTRRYGGESYSRLATFVKPSLEKFGVTHEDVHRITVENPARLLSY